MEGQEKTESWNGQGSVQMPHDGGERLTWPIINTPPNLVHSGIFHGIFVVGNCEVFYFIFGVTVC